MADASTGAVGETPVNLVSERLPNLFSVRDLGLCRNGQWTLKDVSFDLPQGQSLGVIGESGAGKSTLAWLLLGLLEPTRGEVRFLGEPWSDIPEHQRRTKRPLIQALLQDAQASLPPHLTAREILEEPLIVHRHMRESPRQTAILSVAARVHFPLEALNLKPAGLSGGMAQRLSLARALILQPRVLVLDEPHSALDPVLSSTLLGILADLKATGTSLVMVSHDLGAVMRLCDHALVLAGGRTVAQGLTERILGNPRHPYVRGLLAARPTLEGRMPEPWGCPNELRESDGCPLLSRCPHALSVCSNALPITGAERCHNCAV